MAIEHGMDGAASTGTRTSPENRRSKRSRILRAPQYARTKRYLWEAWVWVCSWASSGVGEWRWASLRSSWASFFHGLACRDFPWRFPFVGGFAASRLYSVAELVSKGRECVHVLAEAWDRLPRRLSSFEN